MMTEDEIHDAAVRARKLQKRAGEAHAVTKTEYHYFDKAYFLGRAHAFEEVMDKLVEPEEVED